MKMRRLSRARQVERLERYLQSLRGDRGWYRIFDMPEDLAEQVRKLGWSAAQYRTAWQWGGTDIIGLECGAWRIYSLLGHKPVCIRRCPYVPHNKEMREAILEEIERLEQDNSQNPQ